MFPRANRISEKVSVPSVKRAAEAGEALRPSARDLGGGVP